MINPQLLGLISPPPFPRILHSITLDFLFLNRKSDGVTLWILMIEKGKNKREIEKKIKEIFVTKGTLLNYTK